MCALVLAGTSTLAGATPSKASAAKISAHLTKTSFQSSEAGSVKVIYKFSATSKHFSYLLSLKTGSKWQAVKNVKKKGSFKGSKSMTVKQVFSGKPVTVGSYRLKLSADGGSKTLAFKVAKANTPIPPPTGSKPANTSLPTISGTAKQGQKLTAGKGTWNSSPTSYTYQWRRCRSSGASCSDISGATSGSYALVLADVGSTIRVVVTASNSHGSTSATSSQTKAVAGLPPGAFNKTSPANGATGQPLNTSLSWGSSSNAASYEVCIDKTNNNTCDGSWASMDADTSADTTGLTLGTTYYWQVRAKNAQGTTEADGGSWFSFTVTSPLAGHWTATNGVYFYVMPDQANVIHVDFSYYIDNGSCSGQHEEAWTTTPKPIVSGYFSTYGWTGWSGTGGGADFSGTFDSPTSAHGTAQLSGQCFDLALGLWSSWTNPPFSWTATWQDASQPS